MAGRIILHKYYITYRGVLTNKPLYEHSPLQFTHIFSQPSSPKSCYPSLTGEGHRAQRDGVSGYPSLQRTSEEDNPGNRAFPIQLFLLHPLGLWDYH